MAEEENGTDMQIDHKNSAAADVIGNPKFSVNVLRLLKLAQMEHGLRVGDYTRYRRYCTARLRRLYKSLKFTHGRVKYVKKAVVASTVTEVRFVHLVLYTAERAWSYAMEKKTLPNGPNARQRSYLICRLRKAVKWASLFQELCSIKGDSRTSLEAEAYASHMKGCLLFEQDRQWDVALKCFKSARAVYEELGKYGDLDNQVLCRERVEELEPSIRYCLHKIGESNLETSDLVHLGEMEGPALDLFRAKLEAVMAEARSQQVASMTEFHWLGHRFPISSPKTKVALLKAQELERDVSSPSGDSIHPEKKLAIFEKMFAAYSEARSCIRNDLAVAGNSENLKDELSGLDKAIGALLGKRTIERYQLLVSIAKSKVNKIRDDKNEKVTKPEELVQLYDRLLQNTGDLVDLVSSGRDMKPEEVAFVDEYKLKSAFFRAVRCFYLAKSYSLAGKRAEAYALFGKSRSLTKAALSKVSTASDPDQVILKELKQLDNDCRSNICIEHATGIMEEEKAPQHLSHGIASISIAGNDEKKVEKVLSEKLDKYESAAGDPSRKLAPSIASFPPGFEAVGRNPIVLDLAYNAIEFPALESRMKKEDKGFMSRFWR
ncbi:hypothetical protein M569_02946 [Genlisea aurea]|uniref:Signal recognition particle subunit SRP68 n=1 Tax=Genlisea aurea TaxID=192259 RepID=S8D328_9LAMI|nr:hypothetical protein M569_02946 [Genlisea aurea]